jgi:hypothetical protein
VTGAETAALPSADPTEATGRAVSVAAGGPLPTRPPLAPPSGTQATPTSDAVSTPSVTGHPTPAAAAGAAVSRVPRGLGLAFLGGLLTLGVAALSTSSAGNGGHSPSSPISTTTEPYRLVAPAIRWRVRALADCVRPAPLVLSLELPG